MKPKTSGDRPIGVFDSGVGGLTVLGAIRHRLPAENLLYFGDTAHVPYGSKSEEAVTRYSLAAGRMLARRGVKLLVVACNTASAVALDRMRTALRIPLLGVIAPGVRAAARASARGKVGVIATQATIASGAYERALRQALPGARVFTKACPLFVPLAEEGWWTRPATRLIAREYLGGLRAKGVDALILGCTHYPLLKSVVREALGPKVRLIDSAEETAREVEALCRRGGMLRSGRKGDCRFLASDGPKRFLLLARRFLGSAVKRVSIERLDG